MNDPRDFLTTVRTLSTGERMTLPSVEFNDEPWPSAKLIGEMCCTIVMIARERGYIKKGAIGDYVERASLLRHKGENFTARFRGADFALASASGVFQHAGFPLAQSEQARFDFIRKVVCSAHEKERVEMAREFVALERDIFEAAPGPRGRPKGKGAFDEQDYGLILEAMAAVYATSRDNISFKNILTEIRERIEKSKYPERGSEEMQSKLVHFKRIKRKIPTVFDVFRDRRALLDKKSDA